MIVMFSCLVLWVYVSYCGLFRLFRCWIGMMYMFLLGWFSVWNFGFFEI